MENLDLNAMGVVEMDAKEMKKTDGGEIITWILLTIAGGLLYDGLKYVGENYMETPDIGANGYYGSKI